MFIIPETQWQLKETKDRGRGIFALKDIPGGTVLGDYLGRLSTTKQIAEREARLGALYGMYRDERYTLWPNPKKPGVHLVNHSCMPNTQFVTYKGHMLLMATRRIFSGEELTASYDVTTPEKGDEAMPCLCNTLLCRGTMTTSAAALNRVFKYQMTPDYYAAQRTEGLKLNESVHFLATYPKTIPDQAYYDLFCAEGKLPLTQNDNALPGKTHLRALIRVGGRALNYPRVGVTVYGALHNRLLMNVEEK